MYADFDLVLPGSLNELLDVLADTKDVERMILAGGTVTLVDIRSRKEQPALVVGLDRVAELYGIRGEGQTIAIGGRTTVSDILSSRLIAETAPSLLEASRLFAGQMVRNVATIGGNIACGSPAADLVPPLLSLDAEVELASRSGARRVKLSDYYIAYKKDVRRRDEIVARVLLPPPPSNSINAFYKLARRKGDAITITSVAVTVAAKDGACSVVRIALGSVAPIPMRAKKAEAMLAGKKLSPAILDEAAEHAMLECSPIDDVRATSGYRRKMVKVLTRRLLTQAFERLQ